MFTKIFLAILQFFGFIQKNPKIGGREPTQYSLKIFDDRRDAREAAKKIGVAALLAPNGKHKWLFFKCPCGCGQEIALNLMSGHLPHWRIDVSAPQVFNVHPSVDSTSCGAHFWVQNGRISWCE